MVFVTVGNAKQEFRRLLEAAESQASCGVLRGEHVFIQSGHNPSFRPKYCEHAPFLSGDEFDAWMEKADLIICHGGCTQLHAIRLGKVPVVMPRLRRYGEHVNDHQVQLVEVLHRERLIIPANEPEDLPLAIAAARLRAGSRPPLAPSSMITLVGRAIEELLNHERCR